MPASDLLDLLPVKRVRVDDVRKRFDATVNAGFDPADPQFTDTTPGSIYYDLTQPPVLELVRLWDMVTVEMVAASFVQYAWGEYLDLHGQLAGVARKNAVKATGEATFHGDAGVLIAQGLQVSPKAADANSDPVMFEVTESRLLADEDAPTNVTATPSPTGGALEDGTYYYLVTATKPGTGETIASEEVSATVTGSSGSGSVEVEWAAVDGADTYSVYRSTASGSERLIASDIGPSASYTDVGDPNAADVPPSNIIAIAAVNPGSAGNVAAGAIELVYSPPSGLAAVINDEPTSGGAEVESDDLFRQRILLEWVSPAGGGTISDYERWARNYDPIGFATVEPIWDGPGTVRVIVTDQDNNPVSSTVVVGLQDVLDPVPQEGRGLAPIGAIVTVATPAIVEIEVDITITYEAGYSLDGEDGTTPLRDDITEALSEYIDKLAPGGDVLFNRVEAQVMNVGGVYNVSDLTLNGVADDVTLDSLEVASMTPPILRTA